MSIETLKDDLKANLSTLSLIATPPPGAVATNADTLLVAEQLVRHLKDTLWPFLESVVDEVAEIDECVADVISGAEDILQPETAEIFAAIIAGAVACAATLKSRIDPAAEPQIYKMIAELEKNCKTGESLMAEIVIDTGDDEAEEDDDDEGDDEDDDDVDSEGDAP